MNLNLFSNLNWPFFGMYIFQDQFFTWLGTRAEIWERTPKSISRLHLLQLQVGLGSSLVWGPRAVALVVLCFPPDASHGVFYLYILHSTEGNASQRLASWLNLCIHISIFSLWSLKDYLCSVCE